MDAPEIREIFEARIGEKKLFADRTKMAKFLGLSTTTQTKFFNFLDGADTRFETVIEWMNRLGFTITAPDEKMEGFTLVRMVDAKAGAGESLETSANVVGQYAFRDSFMAREGLHADKCVLMRVIGDSMEPLIREGDTILVDQSQAGRELKDNQIHLVGLDEALMVKRLIKIPKGWRLHSDNKDKSPVDLIGEDMESLRVYGRVRWFGRVV